MDNGKKIVVLVNDTFYLLSRMDDCIRYDIFEPYSREYSLKITPRFETVHTACLWAKFNCL
jgi:hypothetical protein